MTRIVCISDTHNKLDELAADQDWGIPPGDILIHAGDATGRGTIDEVERFLAEFSKLPHKHKIFIAGNHDWLFEKHPAMAEGAVLRAGGVYVHAKDRAVQSQGGLVYLQDGAVTIPTTTTTTTTTSITIYGSPWSPRFYDWAFNADRGKHIRSVWQKIPSGIDVLVTHGPPYGVLDEVPGDGHVGCVDLLEELARIQPRLHVFGHIHGASGLVAKDGRTYGRTYVNASSLDERYHVAFAPYVVDL